MIVKEYGKDFQSECNASAPALTLGQSEVTTDSSLHSAVSTRYHEDSGWTITGYISEDWYYWVNCFTAYHEKYGFVCGNFEDKVCASSEEAFQHFWEHHTPESWDYYDI